MAVTPYTKCHIQDLFQQEKTYLEYFFSQLDFTKTACILDKLLACEGVVFFTGVGKSGYIAKKIAATMLSLGLKAFFLSPQNALHGDLGGVGKDDLLFMLSKSGESEELLLMAPHIKNRGCQLISWVCNPLSRLAKCSDFFIDLPLARELCLHDMAPTTSTEIQLIYGNVLSVAYMQSQNLPIETFAHNHPAGRIGRRVSLRVKDLMVTGCDLPLAKGPDLLGDKLFELSHKRCGCLLITDETGFLKGIFTDGDLRRALEKEREKVLSMPMKSMMTYAPKTVLPGALLRDALQMMEADPGHPVTVMPVVDDKSHLVGLLKLHDVLQAGI